MPAIHRFVTFRRSLCAAALAATPFALAAVSASPAHALCYGAPGKAGEYDGYTSQGTATGPNGTPLAARRVWIYREPQRSDCRTPVIYVFEWRDGRVARYAQGCPLNTVKGAFYAYGSDAFENSNGAFARRRDYTRKGIVHIQALGGNFSKTNRSLVTGSAVGGYGPSSSVHTCYSATVTFHAKWRSGTSGVFKRGGQGYALKRDFDRHHPPLNPTVCDQDVCSTSQA